MWIFILTLSAIWRCAQGAAVCSEGTNIPNLWSFQSLVVDYTEDETVRQGNASFSITNTLTSRTDNLRCSLIFNSLCEVFGTPSDKDLHIWVQVNWGAAAITIAQPWKCDNIDAKDTSVIGMTEVELLCPETTLEEGRSCRSDQAPTFVSGTVQISHDGL